MDSLETRLETGLRTPEQAIGDDGFSATVMRGLPRKRLGNASARRWTLAGAAAAGGAITSVLGAPLESAFSALVLESGYVMAILPALLLVVLAVPVAWVFYSK